MFDGVAAQLLPEATEAVQAAARVLLPPLTPLQPQLHGPDPLGAVCTLVPAAHRPELGAAEKDEPLAVPQAPLTV